MAEFHHGITGRETASGKIPIRDAVTAVIAMLAFADDADEDALPLDTPVLITSINRALPKAGTTGNLRKNLEIIAQITSPTLVVIRINDPNGEVLDQSLVIGTTEDTGQRTGLQALLTVKSVLGITPKIICVPDVETIDVANAIGVICKKLRAYSYITPRNNNGVVLSTASDVVRYRDMLASREIEIIWPEWTSGNVFLGASSSNSTTPSFPEIPEENISDNINYSGWFGLTWMSDIQWDLEIDGVLYKQLTPLKNDNPTGAYNTMDGSIKIILSDHELTFIDAYEDSSGGGSFYLNTPSKKKIRFIPRTLITQYPDKYPKWRTDSGGATPIIDPTTGIWSFILEKLAE